MKAQYEKFLDMIRAIRINVPLVDVLARMPNYGKFVKELVSNKHKLEQVSSTFFSDENLGASINLMPYSLYVKLSLETLKPTKMSVRLANWSFQYPIRISENMLVEVDKFTFPVDFIILKMEEDSKVPLILGRPFLHTAGAVIRVKQKQLNLGVDFNALLDEGSSILYSIKGNPLEEKLFAEFNEFMTMNIKENSESDTDKEEIPFEKITFDTEYKIQKSIDEPPMDLKLKPLPEHLEYAFLKEPSFLPVIIFSQLLDKTKRDSLCS
nr:reverse transcriptase domain-containing protein [Tanacetum cinerariifolium]